MKDCYKTVTQCAAAELIEKRSRFISNVMPVKTEAEAITFIDTIKKKHWDARHNVYAYVLEENNLQRFSDDGEPSGTAGAPVLDIIKKEGLSNVIVIVTRYFGGILLGTGGLVHAYSKSAKLGIDAAVPTVMTLCRRLTVSCDYSLLGKIKNEISANGFKEEGTEYTDAVRLCVFVPLSEAEGFTSRIIDVTNGKACIEAGEIGYTQIT